MFNFLEETTDTSTLVFLMHCLKRCIAQYLSTFSSTDEQLNLSLFKIYSNDLKIQDKGLRYLSLYIHCRRNRKKMFTSEYYHQMNYLADRLIALKELKKARLLLQEHLFSIPCEWQKERETCFKLYHKTLKGLGLPWCSVTSELLKN